MTTQTTMVELLKGSTLKNYKKSGKFTFEIATETKEVVTEINGEVETKNIANSGDYILTGVAGEKYVLKPETFAKRYAAVLTTTKDGIVSGNAVAVGQCWGLEFIGESIEFESPWGDTMIIHEGDMLVSPDEEISQAYRIEKEAFKATYTEVKEEEFSTLQ